MTRKNIAVITGGDSSEYVISLQSVEQVAANIDRTKYNIYVIMMRHARWEVHEGDYKGTQVNKDDFSIIVEGKKITFDCVFVCIHGTPGEDGKLQSYFDMLGIPYTTGGTLAMSLTFSKFYCTNYLKHLGITAPKSLLVRRGQPYDAQEIATQLGFPCFVKPNNGGSSIGASKVKNIEQLPPALEKAFVEDSEVVIEQFVEGTEITCGLIKTADKTWLLPPTEIVSKNEFFDYQAKYDPAYAEEITPARISPQALSNTHATSSRIYDLLNCHGVVRIDYILKGDQPYFIEVNTVPGLTKNSLVPKQIRAYGYSESQLFDAMIEDALQRRNAQKSN